MSRDNTKSSLALVLSIIIHSLLGIAIIYTGLDMALPEGVVNSTEVDYVGGSIPQGSQTEDSSQTQDQVAKVSVPPAPAKPVPAPKAPAAPVITKTLPPATKTVEADAESESEITEAVNSEETTETLGNEQEANTETTAPTESEAPPPAETPMDKAETASETTTPPEAQAEEGTASQNEAAFGSTTPRSDAELSPAPGNKNPDYPMWARLRRQEGEVIVEFEVLNDGSVANTRVTQSSGFEALDASAVKAHEKWRYRPGKSGTFVKKYNFKLTGQAEEAPSQLRRNK